VLVSRLIPFDPNQPLLLPPDLRDALPDGHPALLVGDLVDQLDLSEIEDALPDERLGGAPAFDPRMQLRVWIYAYLSGVRSSRKPAPAIVGNVPSRVLAHNTTPAVLGAEPLPQPPPRGTRESAGADGVPGR